MEEGEDTEEEEEETGFCSMPFLSKEVLRSTCGAGCMALCSLPSLIAA